jgi:hypothetical protein
LTIKINEQGFYIGIGSNPAEDGRGRGFTDAPLIDVIALCSGFRSGA